MGESEKVQKEQAAKIQQKYIEYQMAEQQLRSLQEQLQTVERQKNEARNVQKTLAEFKDAKVGDELLVPVSGGIFFRSTLKESDRFLVNVGANVVVEKDLAGVMGLVDNQLKEIEDFYDKMMAEFTKLALRYNQLEEELKKMVE